MMKYSDRWYYVVSLILITILILFFYIISPARQSIAELQKKQADFIQEERDIKNEMAARHVVVKMHYQRQPEQIADFFALAHQYDVHIQTLHCINHPNFQARHIHAMRVVMSGEWQQMIAFLLHLMRDSESPIVSDFQYEMQTGHQLLVKSEILFFHHLPKRLAAPFDQAHPMFGRPIFCNEPYAVMSSPDQYLLLQTSLSQMKMSGYLKQGKTVWGMVSLPNGVTFAIHVGEHVGSEGGKIVQIVPDYFMVLVKNIQYKVTRYAVSH